MILQLGYGVSFVDNGESPFRWRFPIAFQIIPLLGLVAFCWFFPESPRWLCKVGRDDEALFVLGRLRGTTGEDAGIANIELKDIQNVVGIEKSEGHDINYFKMFFGTCQGQMHITRRTHLCIWLQIMQSWTGISGVTIYGPSKFPNPFDRLCYLILTLFLAIFTIAGFTAHKAQWLSGVNNILYMFATLICVFTLDRIGRRKTLYWGSVAQGIAMFLVGGLSAGGLSATADGRTSTAKTYGAAAASMVIIYTFVFGATWLTVCLEQNDLYICPI